MLRAGRHAHFADLASELNGCFVGFRAGVADEGFGGGMHCASGESFGDDLFGEFTDPRVVVKVGGVDKSAGLFIHSQRRVDGVLLQVRRAPAGTVTWQFLDHYDREH